MVGDVEGEVLSLVEGEVVGEVVGDVLGLVDGDVLGELLGLVEKVLVSQAGKATEQARPVAAATSAVLDSNSEYESIKNKRS